MDLSPEQITDLCYFLERGAKLAKEHGMRMFDGDAGAVEWIVQLSLAIGKAAANKSEFRNASKFFGHAHNFATLLPDSKESAQVKQASALLECAATLENLTSSCNEVDKELLNNLLSVLARYRGATAADEAVLFFLMEVKTRLLLREPDNVIERTIDEAVSSFEKGSHKSVYERLAAILFSTGNAKLGRDCLERALELHRKSRPFPWRKYAMLQRKLVEEAPSQKTAFDLYLERILPFFEGMSGRSEYPQEEIRWLFSHAWNRGTSDYKLSRFSSAEKWMSTSLQLLKHYAKCEDYEDQLLKAYNECLGRV